MSTFPVSQSVLDAGALARELARRYGFAAPVRCRLISRGMNDIYEVKGPDVHAAAKVARAGKSTDGEFGYEQAYVQHLARAGFAVPTPLPLTDGTPFFAVDAPEGRRQIALMRWLDGVPLAKTMTTDDARRCGGFLARLHLASAGFRYPVARPLNAEVKLARRLPLLLEMVGDHRDAAALLSRAAAQVIARVGALEPAAVPRGSLHGDFQYANIMALPGGGLATFDFSDCGQDVLARDLAGFFWRADFDGVGAALNGAFVAGYDAVRPLSPAERAALPVLRAARHLLITASMAEFVDRVGPVPGFDANLRYYLSMIRLHCAEAGLI
ncbi:MAG: phosphotransferase [Rhodospirillaceae bacterium]|nr:phosphotransferase [Rhodospirillaceae bacterium]